MYENRILRVDLTQKKTSVEHLDKISTRRFIGGAGVGAHLIYREIPVGTRWSDPENLLVLGAGPLNATSVAGAGSFCVVTKGALTNGATSTQANGFFGAFLRLSGFETIVIQGAAQEWLYLHIHDGIGELKSAADLVGKDTRETEELIREKLGKKRKEVSVYSIGPAGENRARFAAIVGDEGHVAAHNGVGAVMGSKKLKAVVVQRGREPIEVKDPDRLADLNRQMLARTKKERREIYEEGTSFLVAKYVHTGVLPVKNMTTNIFTDYERLTGAYYRKHFILKPQPCWRCPLNHVHTIEVTEGPYKGYKSDEPEYEVVAGWGPLIGQADPGAVVMLSDTADRLGFDSNEASWLIGLVMECYEKGVLSQADTDGLKMTWGNVEAVRDMLHKIARREGIGDVLADGVMRAAQKIGGEALNMAVYLKKGHAPRGHDHRMRWLEMVDAATSDCGTIAVGPQAVEDPFSPEAITDTLSTKRIRPFVDSMVVCAFPSNATGSSRLDDRVEMLNAATGWDYDENEAMTMALRTDTLMRAFNIRHGLTPELESISTRYSSAQVDGPAMAKSIQPYWEEILDLYYKKRGWDRKTGKPLVETLLSVGLEEVVQDLW